MIFNPGNNELDVMVNQLPLHKDQYTELSLDMLDSLPADVRNAIRNNYGWDNETIYKINELYDNIGIGIMLNEPLDSSYGEGLFNADNQLVNEKELYVEIIANRACSSFNNKRKLQRNATYIYENNFTVTNTFNTTINLDDISYRYGENQLEVFINGTRLIKDVDFVEGTDLDDDLTDLSIMLRSRGAISKQFRIERPIHIGDVITYKIMANFYSYDHINSLIDKLETDQEACNSKVQTLYDSTMQLHDNTNTALEDMQKQITAYSNVSNNAYDSFLTRESIIGIDQLDPSIANRIPQSIDHIFHVRDFDSYSVQLGIDMTEYLRERDFVMVWWRDVANNNIDRMLLPDDYTIDDTESNGKITTTFKLSNEFLPNLKTGDKLIFRGIKFGGR